jgi:hypothetical protein
MSEPTLTSAVAGALTALRHYGVVPQVETRLLPGAEQAIQRIQGSALKEVAAYSESANPDVLPELEQHFAEHIAALAGLLSAGPADIDFVRRHASRCAAQKFPLVAVLASYRSLHRIAATWIRDAALESANESAHMQRVVAAVSEFIAEYVGAISTVMTSEYVAQTRILAEAEGDRRSELLRLLLSGYDESDPRAAKLLRRAGYLEQRQSFCVAVARSVDAREMESSARAQRMADAVALSIRDLPVRSLIGVHDNLVIAVLSGTRRLSGWTAAETLLAERVFPNLRTIGTAALIGLSSDAPSTSHIPKALGEAKLALDFSSVSNRVVSFAEIPFRNILVSVGAEHVQSTLPSWASQLRNADTKSRGALTATLRAYADANMNVLKTAEALALHPNTIYARMQKINDLTHRNPLSFHALTELLLVTDCSMLDQ